MQVALLLRVGAERVDRPADDRVLHADDRRRRAVAGGDLLERDGERHVVERRRRPSAPARRCRARPARRARAAPRAENVLAIPARGVRRELARARTRAACRGSSAARRSGASARSARTCARTAADADSRASSPVVERELRGDAGEHARQQPALRRRPRRARAEPARDARRREDEQRVADDAMTSWVAPSTSDCASTLPRAGSTNCGKSAS